MSLLPVEHEPQDQALHSDVQQKLLDIKTDGILIICKKKKKKKKEGLEPSPASFSKYMLIFSHIWSDSSCWY